MAITEPRSWTRGEAHDDPTQPLAALAALIASLQHHQALPHHARRCLEQMKAQVSDIADHCSRLGAVDVGCTRTGASPWASGLRGFTVVICDDHQMFGESLAAVLESRGYEVVACTGDPAAAVAQVRVQQPDIMVMDLGFRDVDGVDVLEAALDASPATRAIVLSGRASPDWPTRARRAGAAACLGKHTEMDRILDAIEAVALGGEVFESPSAPPADDGGSDLLRMLTQRERQVLDRLVEGQSTETIAAQMAMAHSTARSHIQKVLCKLGVHSRLEAVALVSAPVRGHRS